MEIEMEKMEEEVEMGEVMAKATGWCWNRNEKVPPIYARRLPKFRGRERPAYILPSHRQSGSQSWGLRPPTMAQPTHSLPLTI
jgi:hypothetical protein